MLRKSIYHKPLSQHHKKQKSQDNKPTRSRKQNISPSPLYKQLLLNKQNIHPNKNAPSQSAIPCVILSPVRHSAIDNNAGIDKYREEYYQIKENRYNSRQIKLHLNNNAANNINQHNIANSCMDVRQTVHLEGQNYGKCGIPVIDTRINSHSLEKCQRHDSSEHPPVIQFVIPMQDKKQLLLCQNCACHYRHKIPIQKLTNTQISNNNNKSPLTVSAYFNMLSNKIQSLSQMYENLLKAEQQFLRQSSQQSEKHRKYYNSVLEIIQQAMQKSQQMFSKWVREGQSVIRKKKQQIQSVLKLYNCEMKKLLEFQEKSIQLSPLRNSQARFNVQAVAQDYNTEICLPVLGIHTQIAGILENFKTSFNQFYAIKMLTQSQLQQSQKPNHNLSKLPQQKTTSSTVNININPNTNSIPRNNFLSPTARNNNPNQSSSNNNNRYADDGDLFCHEDIRTDQRDPNNSNSHSGSCHNFSFDRSQGSALPKNQCIIELVDEEDVISPVFKAI